MPAGELRDRFRGCLLELALDAATELLRARPHQGETLAALTAARALALRGDPTPEKLETLGGGWVAEEALAIAVYAALSHPRDLRAALLLAVNHSGDSDSTAAICGNLLGAALGESALPEKWLAELEGRAAIAQRASDLLEEDQDLRPKGNEWGREEEFEEWWGRYFGVVTGLFDSWMPWRSRRWDAPARMVVSARFEASTWPRSKFSPVGDSEESSYPRRSHQ